MNDKKKKAAAMNLYNKSFIKKSRGYLYNKMMVKGMIILIDIMISDINKKHCS